MAKVNFTYAKGARKESSARVRIFRGKGENTVNEIPAEKYFPGIVMESAWKKPFRVTETTDKYYFSAKVEGGGKEGQLDALVNGIAKALVKTSAEKYKKELRKFNLLTRDSRMRQRRMIGMGGKARRKKQSPKR
jgi:small subunit ribosomal protein S9